MRKIFLLYLIIATILFYVCYFIPVNFPPLNKALTFFLEKRLDAKISFGRMNVKLLDSIKAEDIKAAGRGGMIILAKNGKFSYNLVSLLTMGRLEIKCGLQDVSIMGDSTIVDFLTDLLAIEKVKNLNFSSVEGTFFMGRGDTITQNLKGASEFVKFCVDGTTQKDNSINLRLRLFLNDSFANTMPQEVRNAILTRAEGPWMSILIGITGNYKEPSLRIISDRFRLDINAGNR